MTNYGLWAHHGFNAPYDLRRAELLPAWGGHRPLIGADAGAAIPSARKAPLTQLFGACPVGQFFTGSDQRRDAKRV